MQSSSNSPSPNRSTSPDSASKSSSDAAQARRFGLTERLRYAFDNTMSKGAVALIGWLFLVSMLLIGSIALVVVLLKLAPGEETGPMPFTSALWMTLMRAMDAGTVAGDTGSTLFLTVMFITTLGGIFLVSILIGLLTSGIESRLEELRKGRSFVCEQNHTLILGWNPQVFSIVTELIKARSAQAQGSHSGAIVIMADRDKVEMEDDLREKIGATGSVRLVCRSGSPIDRGDLSIANPFDAASIIILAPETENPDSSVIKTLLALTYTREKHTRPLHIVAEIREPKNMDVARMVAKDEVELIPVEQVVASIMVQTCRQSGLSIVYQELLDFDGDEIYLRREPSLAGKTFGESLAAYSRCTVLGVCSPDAGVQLNPPMEMKLQPQHQLVMVAEDDSTIVCDGKGQTAINASLIQDGEPTAPSTERLLVLGWNRKVPTILNELDQYVASGSEVLVVAEGADIEASLENHCQHLTHLRLEFRQGDVSDAALLRSLNPSDYSHVLCMSDSDRLGVQEADAQTLITLLHLRQLAAETHKPFAVVSEMLDMRNRELAEVTRADDFIVSDRLVSLLMSQVSENKHLGAVFADLFDPEGAEIYLRPAEHYLQLGQSLNFYTVVEAARRRGHIAMGYRVKSESHDPNTRYGVHLNPNKTATFTLQPGDQLIVLASM